MKKNWKRIASLFLSVLLLLSMTVTPVMAGRGESSTDGSKIMYGNWLYARVYGFGI